MLKFFLLKNVGKSERCIVLLVLGILVLVLDKEENDAVEIYFKRKVSSGCIRMYFSVSIWLMSFNAIVKKKNQSFTTLIFVSSYILQ